MKTLAILGSTGSIGRNTLKIVEMFPEQFNVKALTAAVNVDLLADQIIKFKPDMAVVYDERYAKKLQDRLPAQVKVEILFGKQGYQAAASINDADTVVAAMVGAAGLLPTLAAIDAGKQIALANKETLVMAGELVMQRASDKGIDILPIDSEHSAIFQCMAGNRKSELSKILLTGSGGPFRKRPADTFADIQVEDALNHPNWAMGRKISIDSATLMNKGLEFIEAKHLFGVSEDMIEVVIHPQSIIHSMVAYCDGSVIAQLGIPDMKEAIAYTLSYPKRLPLNQPLPEFAEIGKFTFEKPDLKRFPCLKMAFEASKQGGTSPAVLNAANEIAVHSFLNKQIAFTDIAKTIRQTLDLHTNISQPTLEDILEADTWAREQSELICRK
ncbi:1-deoxy-D-xylulose-5-phosphate reductoisomerase [Desulfococcaceae bacterium HSG9]|nr:1-deoxy-D-xylulose-5-phosphate reductoisomerase [Desulfococcaceae bacterium HSG9]